MEELKHEQYVAEKKLTAVKHKEKRLESEIKRLTRSERTHRLCTRAEMLETFLREPTVLTDDDVMELCRKPIAGSLMISNHPEEAILPLRCLATATPLWTCCPGTIAGAFIPGQQVLEYSLQIHISVVE